jgi:hypothetical protein
MGGFMRSLSGLIFAVFLFASVLSGCDKVKQTTPTAPNIEVKGKNPPKGHLQKGMPDIPAFQK